MVRRPRELVRSQDVELLLVREEAFGIELGDLLGGLALGKRGGYDFVLSLLQHLLPHVTHVRDVLHMIHGQPLDLQDALNPVGHQV